MFDTLTWKEVVTLTVALLGAILGVMNTWNTISQRRIRLRIKPAYAISSEPSNIGFCIEVVNLSTFPVTITDLGFFLPETKERLAITKPLFLDKKPWPRRLEAREALTAYFHQNEVFQHYRRIGKAYARTSCGYCKYGTSTALKQLQTIQEEIIHETVG